MLSATRSPLRQSGVVERRIRGLTRFCGQCLADTRRAGKQHDHAFALALDHIVKGLFVSNLTLGESKNELFVIVWENEAVECTFVVLDVFHRADGESEPFFVAQRVAFE